MQVPCFCAQDVGDMHILALLQQAQVQRAAEEALTSLDDSSRQAQIASEAQQDLDLKVMMLIFVILGATDGPGLCKCLNITRQHTDGLHMGCIVRCIYA